MNTSSSSARRRRFPWRFGLQTLLIAILLVSVLLAWWRDHVQLAQQLELQEMRLRFLEESQRAGQPRSFYGGSFGFSGSGFADPRELEVRFATASAYVDYLESAPNSGEVQTTFHLLNRVSWADQAVPLLAGMLKSQDAEHRRRAVLAFSDFRKTDDAVVPLLVPLLDDSQPDVQNVAVKAIRQHGQAATDAVPALQRHAESLTSPIAVDALLTLDSILVDFSIESLLVKLLDHQDQAVQMQAVRALPDHLDAARAETILTEMFYRETSAELREEIASAINSARISQPPKDGP